MTFEHPETVEQVIWVCKMADYPRGVNRAKIDDLLNGFPPYSESEVSQNNLAVNVPFPENGPVIAHDARRQLDNALLLPDPLFDITVDHGPKWKKQEWSSIITEEMNQIIRNSREYQESQKGINAMNVAHGIGPSVWLNKYSWCPVDRGMDDVLIPGNILLSMRNLPFYAVYEQYTAAQLWRDTHGPLVDPGWNMPMVEAAIKWVDQEAQKLMSNNATSVIWSPEKMSDRFKQDSGLYACDSVPTIDTYHFYWWDDSDGKSGWRKKIVLDAWGQPNAAAVATPPKAGGKYGIDDSKKQFLYDSGKRKVADKIDQLVHFQIANCSNKAPFRYHSVRSLGFLIYAVCHLQNRLQCKFSESTFESLMQYYRVNNVADAERALKINLTDKTPLPDGVQFVRQEERWKVEANLVELSMQVNRQSIDRSSTSYAQDFDTTQGQNETATRTMAKVNNNAAMVSGMTNQAYSCKKFQYMEIARRFCIKNSRDPDVKRFRVNVLRKGVPEEALNSACWDIRPTRVLGSGNKVLQSAMVDRAMTVYTKLDPQAQRKVLRMKLAIDLDDYSLAQDLVPDEPHITNSVHDAQLSAGNMLGGTQMGLMEGVNHSEYIEAMMVTLGAKVQEIDSRGGVCTPEELTGMQNVAGLTVTGQPIQGNGIANHLKIMEQDAEQPHERGQAPDNTVKEQVKEYSDHLKVLMNQIRAFAQRMQDQQQKQQAQTQPDPEVMAKIQTDQAQTQAKIELQKQTHAEKTAQKQITFEQKQQQDAEKHQQELQKQAASDALELTSEAERQRLKTEQAKQKPASPKSE